MERKPNRHVIAVDNSLGAEEAFKFACETLPKEDEFTIVSGSTKYLTYQGTWKTKSVILQGTYVEERIYQVSRSGS